MTHPTVTAPAVDTDRANSYRRLGLWTDVLVHEHIRPRYVDSADRTALVDGARRLTYRELGRAVASVRDRLRKNGVAPGDRVAVALPNCAESVVVVLATLEAGGTPVLVLPAFREHELERIVATAQPVAFVLDVSGRNHEALSTVRSLRARHPCLQHVVIRGGASAAAGEHDLDDWCAPTEAAEPSWDRSASPGDPAVYLLSSGTTGLPKSIARTHESYSYMIRTALTVNAVTDRTVNLVVMPVQHGFVLNCPGILGTLFAGGTVVLSTPESPSAAFSLIEREGVTHCTLVPAVALRWASEAAVTQRDLSTLSVLLVGGSRLAAATAADLEARLGTRIQQCYGMSEGLLCYTRLDDPDDVVHGTQGRPLSEHDEIRVIDENDQDVEPGAAGELITRGPYTVAGYVNNAAASTTSFTADGFYRTGDMARLDTEGNIEILGRVRDVINRGGEKISPEEIEALLIRHTDIHAAAAVAVPHAVYGDSVGVFAVLEPTATDGPDLIDIRAFLTDRGLAKFKLPEHFEPVTHLPLTGVGKVDKAALRKLTAPASTR